MNYKVCPLKYFFVIIIIIKIINIKVATSRQLYIVSQIPQNIRNLFNV